MHQIRWNKSILHVYNLRGSTRFCTWAFAFFIYINDITQTSSFNTAMFADDINLHMSAPNVRTLQRKVNPFSPVYATFLAELCNPTTRQAIKLESRSNPRRIQQGCSQNRKKKFSFWVWAFLGGTSQVWVFLHYFGHLCLALGAVPMGHFLDSKFSWKLGQNPRL